MQRFEFLVNLLFTTASRLRRPQLLDFVNLFIGEANYSKRLQTLARVLFANVNITLTGGQMLGRIHSVAWGACRCQRLRTCVTTLSQGHV